MEKEIKLLPCPFCGGKANLRRGWEFPLAVCSVCDAATKCGADDADAATIWNTRQPLPHADLREALMGLKLRGSISEGQHISALLALTKLRELGA